MNSMVFSPCMRHATNTRLLGPFLASAAHPKKFLTGFRGERCNQSKAGHTGSAELIQPDSSFMKKIALLTLAAVLGSFSSAFASSPSSCVPCSQDGACAVSTCCEIKCAEGESVAAARERVMATEL